MGKFFTNSQFIEKAKIIHGEFYDYSLVEYVNSKTKIKIVCPKHGIFLKVASDHLQGIGCPSCGKNIPTTNEFISLCSVKHNNFYNYEKTIYKNARSLVVIICPIHGEFKQKSEHHLLGSGCPKCGNLNKGTLRPLNYYLDTAKLIHGDKYDYSKVSYINSKKKVKIICPEHGEFKQTLQAHVSSSHGCPTCGADSSEFKTKMLSEFIIQGNKIHNNRYSYNFSDYKHSFTKITITCNKHGNFEQLPSNHLSGNGCPVCSCSRGELIISDWLSDNKILFTRQFQLKTEKIARNSNLILIDFFVQYNNKKYFIEYDGEQHYSYVPFFHRNGLVDLEAQQNRDKVLAEFCEINHEKFILIRLKYTLNKNQIINKLKQHFQ